MTWNPTNAASRKTNAIDQRSSADMRWLLSVISVRRQADGHWRRMLSLPSLRLLLRQQFNRDHAADHVPDGRTPWTPGQEHALRGCAEAAFHRARAGMVCEEFNIAQRSCAEM